ncbi:hypothetical protein [Chryseolinea sp. H1M3-3]|uniref:hypothetical protein n=1 Tax=Chryseolinea sp. H1M3-3 TaxID=3034144 RepID=UPI0023EDE827|nr:hypothetical protein [Chryseolinea sp. H1M3-3]
MDELKLILPKGQRSELMDFYLNKQRDLEIKLREVKGIIAQLQEAVVTPADNQLSITHSTKVSNPVYRENWSWSQKIKYVIEDAGRCLTTRQIIDRLRNFEPLIGNPINSVSGTISGKISNSIMFNRYHDLDSSEFFIGLEEWFTVDGNVKEKYLGVA